MVQELWQSVKRRDNIPPPSVGKRCGCSAEKVFQQGPCFLVPVPPYHDESGEGRGEVVWQIIEEVVCCPHGNWFRRKVK